MSNSILIKGGTVVTMDEKNSIVRGDLLDLAANNRVVEKSGAWFSYKGERLGQGRENAKQTLKDQPEVLKRVENDVKRALGIAVRGEAATAEAPVVEQKKAAAAAATDKK